jgi:cytochrome c553
MKSLIVLLLTVSVLAYACSFKASPAVTDALIPKQDAVSTDPKVIQAGETVFMNDCTECHKAKTKKINSKTYEDIRRTLATMVKKAKLNEEQIAQVSAYVNANSKK